MKKLNNAELEFAEAIKKSMATYYSRCLSESVKRGIARAKAKKLSTLTNSSLCKE